MGTISSVKSRVGAAQAADKSNTTTETKRINISAPYIARSATKPAPA
jgi:hypothetical protein